MIIKFERVDPINHKSRQSLMVRLHDSPKLGQIEHVGTWVVLRISPHTLYKSSITIIKISVALILRIGSCKLHCENVLPADRIYESLES